MVFEELVLVFELVKEDVFEVKMEDDNIFIVFVVVGEEVKVVEFVVEFEVEEVKVLEEL